MKKLISTITITTALLAPAIVMAEGDGGQDVAQQLAEVQAKLKTQQQVMEALSEVAAGAGGGSNFKLGNDAIDSFTIKGDLRVRYERRDRDNYGAGVYDDALDRLRTRFRVGGVWKNKKESWEVGAGLCTGGDDGRSTNDTWSDSNYFKTGDIRLDYAYATHKMGDAFSVTLGQQINPYYSSWILWDSDLRPFGLTAQFKQNGIFVTLSADDVYQNGDDIAFVLAGQAGYEGKAGSMNYKLAGAYYAFDSKLYSPTAGGNISKRPNPDYDYTIGALTGEFGGEAGPVKWKARGEYWKNFGADGSIGQGALAGTLDPQSEDTGWTIGAEAKIKDFKVSYDYVSIGADSANPYLKDSDFGNGLGSGVDVKGHRLGAGYNVSKNCSLDATAMLYEPMTRSAEVAKVESVNLYMLDFNYKF
ncbi:MAG: hypothetical protein HGA96_14445 [Desulfobulbaceae bacterium]|nr:hypothetical protein [Desulfobulbaceae bacterium]